MITIQIEIDEEVKDFNFPTSWEEVTVEQFIKIFTEKSVSENGLMATVKIISAISGIDEELIMMMGIEDFKNLSKHLSFIEETMEIKNVEYIELEGDKYYLYTDFNKLTTGEIITIETLMEAKNGNIYEVMGELLCVFLRKKKDNGDFEKFKTNMLQRKTLFMKANISDIHHIFNFFLDGRNLFNHNTRDYISHQDQSKPTIVNS
jgi:hypothetical protein